MAGFSLVLLTQEASVHCALGKESNRSLLLQQNFKLQFKGPCPHPASLPSPMGEGNWK
jgi:hypothetical protein